MILREVGFHHFRRLLICPGRPTRVGSEARLRQHAAIKPKRHCRYSFRGTYYSMFM